MMFGRLLIYSRALRLALVVAIAARIVLCAEDASADTAEAKKIFTTRCMACHTFGKGVKIGPDLKGVNDRRQRDWLLKFVRTSSVVIASGDSTANDLLTQFKGQRMPDWTDLSEAQIGSILDYLKANGPDQVEPDARSADSATIAEIDAGRQLFHGGRALSRGGLACASCHSIHDENGASGGVLAGDLTSVYSQYQDGAMTQFLRQPCFMRFPESQLPAFLAPEESFALKSYLRSCALIGQPAEPSRVTGAQPPMVAKPIDSPAAGVPPAAAGTADAKPANAGKRVVWVPNGAGTSPGGHHPVTLQTELLFQLFPYIAFAILILGLGIRHALARQRPEAIAPAADAAWQEFRGTAAWRIGLAITVIVHVACLLVPGAIRAWDGAPLRLYLLEGTGFVFGFVALVGVVQVMLRHIRRSVAAHQPPIPEVADYALLTLLLVATLSGLSTAVRYRWGSSWEVGTLTPYLWSLARGEPATALVQQMPFLVRLHVFTWFAVLAVVPFTSFAMVLVAAGDRAVLLASRPIGAAGRTGRRALGKLSPARWLWPEEDLPGDGGDAQEPS
jgi:nitrate reductase gamma subunit